MKNSERHAVWVNLVSDDAYAFGVGKEEFHGFMYEAHKDDSKQAVVFKVTNVATKTVVYGGSTPYSEIEYDLEHAND